MEMHCNVEVVASPLASDVLLESSTTASDVRACKPARKQGSRWRGM